MVMQFLDHKMKLVYVLYVLPHELTFCNDIENYGHTKYCDAFHLENMLLQTNNNMNIFHNKNLTSQIPNSTRFINLLSPYSAAVRRAIRAYRKRQPPHLLNILATLIEGSTRK